MASVFLSRPLAIFVWFPNQDIGGGGTNNLFQPGRRAS
jgi:hypothetical protein